MYLFDFIICLSEQHFPIPFIYTAPDAGKIVKKFKMSPAPDGKGMNTIVLYNFSVCNT